MNLGNIPLELRFERAVQFLCNHMPAGEERKKPLLMHALRVGVYVFDRNYSDAVVLGGLLHDVLEWTNGSGEAIDAQFGARVRAIVEANTKNRALNDPAERRREYIDRCVALGEDAVIVKTADVLDSYRFYTATGNADEVARCVDIAHVILKKLPTTFQDPIFEELRRIHDHAFLRTL